ncbi:protein NKG7-like [Alligator sinensis]|uniref:Protein NKG7-like n=1 Tax=Alligator sinensis TaxID=38654 RepID=A0A3Q0FUZ3_ALLSI|nr:protein NKG7-like [Alligator sinensis]
MPGWGVAACLLAGLGEMLLLTALSTEYWMLSRGPQHTGHSGLWQVCVTGLQEICVTSRDVTGTVQATRICLALAAVLGVLYIVLAVAAVTSCPCRDSGVGPGATIVGFAAGVLGLVAMVVFTAGVWDSAASAQVQSSFGWSFSLGWAGPLALLLAGGCTLLLHLRRGPYSHIWPHWECHI